MLEPKLQRFEDSQFQPKHWLELIHNVQALSESWEAAYLEKPRFSPDCDFIFTLNDQLIGIGAGYRINNMSSDYSLEVLAICPELQGKGLGKKLLEAVSSHLDVGSSIRLYTQSPKVANWYHHIGWKKSLDLHLTWKKKEAEDSLTLGNGHRSGKAIWHYRQSCPWTS